MRINLRNDRCELFWDLPGTNAPELPEKRGLILRKPLCKNLTPSCVFPLAACYQN
jgi:hypothetical protein